uniref:Uncharacterized protein n=1 Tax=Anguilla anguilla TaxID=7936 RepID=A0A0E9RKG6_ANGAN
MFIHSLAKWPRKQVIITTSSMLLMTYDPPLQSYS